LLVDATQDRSEIFAQGLTDHGMGFSNAHRACAGEYNIWLQIKVMLILSPAACARRIVIAIRVIIDERHAGVTVKAVAIVVVHEGLQV
jgi:hypothetical protein